MSGVYLGTVGLNGVMNVDEDEEDGDEQRHPPRYHLRVHQERYPANTHTQYWLWGQDIPGFRVK